MPRDAHDLLLRKAELHRDRLQLGNDHHPVTSAAWICALVDLAQPARSDSGAMSWCSRVARMCRSAPGRLDPAPPAARQAALGIGLLLGAGVAGGKLLITGQVDP